MSALQFRVLAGLWFVAFLVVSFVAHPLAPVLEPDSASYIQMSGIRQLGYPLVLKLFGQNQVVVFQIIMAAASTLLLGREIARTEAGPGFALLTMLAVSANPFVHEYHYHVLTESLFISLLTGFLAMLVSFFRAPSWRPLAAAAVFAGLAGCIRPNGYVLIVVLAVAVLLVRQRVGRGYLRYMLVALMPVLVLVAAERLSAAQIHGPAGTSLAGRHFFAKAALLDVPENSVVTGDPVAAQLNRAAVNDFAPIRDLIRQADDANQRSVLTEVYETCLEYACAEPLRGQTALPESELNRIALGVAMQRIAAAPGQFLALVGVHLRSLWVLYSHSHPSLLPGFTAFITAHRPLPFEAGVSGLVEPAAPSRLALVLRPGVIALGLITLVVALMALPAMFRNPPPILAGAVAAALTVHGSQLLVALVGVGIPRYTMALWPAIIVACVMVAAAIWRRMPQRPQVMRR